MAERSYAERICEVMDLEAPPTIKAQPLRKSVVEFSRIASQRTDNGTLPTPIADAFLVSLELRALPEVNIWLDGRHYRKGGTKTGNFSLVNFNVETVVEMNLQFDSIQMYFPRTALNAIAVEQGVREVGTLDLDFLNAHDDVVVRSLGHCLLPAFEHPERANRLFIDHIAAALLAHMLQAYGGSATAPLMVRGGLAPWQMRRAKEMLMARLDGEITLEELAGECELSRGHFARAFRKTTGRPPHRWLVEQRIERAKGMLLNSDLPLAEIAGVCGFSDQSHFTKVFTAAVSIPPGEWRRLRCS
ncbi:AraC family transcriptional regulator [Bradyrhizobium sp. dw_411]|uniref:helix-turn-helix domain-containing protein n=1 Tax=Bradyrhizobium sp. dw_411 TaxID=2720082 RepID=UPI001BD0E0AD|nr:AraC family transcriptional regulator [Bradyrhizobium sp. dw_411]